MPIYDYKCARCGHRFEYLTSISQRSSVACPACGGPVERVYEGKWSMGFRKGSSQNGGCSDGCGSGKCGCGGNCAGCSGCGG